MDDGAQRADAVITAARRLLREASCPPLLVREVCVFPVLPRRTLDLVCSKVHARLRISLYETCAQDLMVLSMTRPDPVAAEAASAAVGHLLAMLFLTFPHLDDAAVSRPEPCMTEIGLHI